MADDFQAVEQLRQSRSELRALLQPEFRQSGRFPRSVTMRFLMNGKGRGMAAAALGALLLARLPLARKLFRLVPTSALLRLFLKGQ